MRKQSRLTVGSDAPDSQGPLVSTPRGALHHPVLQQATLPTYRV